MTTPANTPPAVCPECAAGTLRTHDGFHEIGNTRRFKRCRDATPTDEGRGTEPLCAKCGAQKGSLKHYPHGAAYSHDYQPPSPQQGGGEPPLDYPAAARVIALHLAEFCERGTRFPDAIAEAARQAGAEITRLRTALAESQRREQEAREAVGERQQLLVRVCNALGVKIGLQLMAAARADENYGDVLVRLVAEAHAAEATLTALRSKLQIELPYPGAVIPLKECAGIVTRLSRIAYEVDPVGIEPTTVRL